MKVVHDIDRQKWSDFVENHPNGNVFQTPEMYEVYKNTKNYEPVFLSVVDEKNEILAVLLAVVQRDLVKPIGNLTSRSIVWGGPLIRDNDNHVIELILRKFNKLMSRKSIYSQFRNLWDFSDKIGIFSNCGYKYSDHLNYFINLSVGKDKLFSNLSASKRRQIKKSIKQNNVKIIDTESEDDVLELYRILSHLYSKYVKKPLPSVDFFLNILKILVKNNIAKIFVVKHDGKIIGGIVCPISYNLSRTTIYELYVCGSREHKNLFPGVIATWAPMEWGSENRINYFDFMGAGKPDEDYGVREFKSKFGGDLVQYGRFEKINQPLKFQLAKKGFKLWQSIKS